MKTFLKNQWGLRRLEGPVLPLAAFLMSLVLSGIIMALCGYNPSRPTGPSWWCLRLSPGARNTFVQATPLIFTGLAYTFAKRLP